MRMQKLTLEMWVEDLFAVNEIVDAINCEYTIKWQEDDHWIVADEDSPSGTGWRWTIEEV